MIEHLFTSGTLMRFAAVPLEGRDTPHRDGFKMVPPSPITFTFLPKGSDQWTTAVAARAQWLPWISGAVSETALLGLDVFSGPFSGCWMVAYRDGPMRYVGHIGTDTNRPANTKSAKRAWQRFAVANEDSLLAGLNACRDYQGPFPDLHGGVERPQLYGLITPDLRCFTVVLYQQVKSEPLTYRVVAIKESARRSTDALRDVFVNDPEVHDLGLPFTMQDWRASTTGGAFHTRSTQLKDLDTALAAYFKTPCLPTLDRVRTAFGTWRQEKAAEYKNPYRNRRNCIRELEKYLAA